MIDGKKFRIYPTKGQQSILSQWVGHQRFVFNAKVSEDRYFRRFRRKTLALTGCDIPVDQQYSHFVTDQTTFLKNVPSQILRNGAYRWMTGYQRFFKGVAKGRPTIKKKTGRQSVLITSELFTFYSVDKETAMLRLGTKKHPVGDIEIKVHREYLVPKSVCISVHGGKWYLSFNCEDDSPVPTEEELLSALQYLTVEQLAEVTRGFDRNVKIPVVGSNGSEYNFTAEQKRSMGQASRGKIKWQKRFARRQKGSANSRKAARRVARYDRKIADIRDDFAHKTSHAIADDSGSLLVFEDLSVKNMTASAKGTTEKPGRNVRQKAGLNKAILNVAWGRILTYTKYKGLRNSKLTIVVPAPYSSQECRRCGHTNKENRPEQAVFICQACGYTDHADHNASSVVQWRGVHAVIAGLVKLKTKKQVGFTKSVARRAGTARTGAQAPTPVERVSDMEPARVLCSSR